jgi:serine/threonine protein kinase
MSTTTALPEQFGRYRILQKLGEGGMGAVYLAEDSQLGRRVALKVPHFTADDSPDIIDRFYREARVAAGIDHVNICTVYDVGQINGIHYLTMPYIDGTPLARLLDRDAPWPPPRAAALIVRLALALHVMHQKGIMHRDLKPASRRSRQLPTVCTAYILRLHGTEVQL